MENSSSRILTTHVDSLVRPPEIRGLMRGKEFGQEYDREELARGVRSGVGEVVQRQLAESIGIPSDGEYGKSEFSAYVTECLRVLNPVSRTRIRAFYSIGAGTGQYFENYIWDTTRRPRAHPEGRSFAPDQSPTKAKRPRRPNGFIRRTSW